MISKNNYIGLFLALSSGVGFMASNTLAGVSYQFGTNPLTVTATRFILPAILLIWILRLDGISLALPKRITIFSFLLGLITVIYNLALLSAIEILPLAIAILIFYLFPILTGLMLATLSWQKLSLTAVITGLIAFSGIALALGVEFANLKGWGIIYATLAAVGLATVCVISSRLMDNEDARVVTFYMCISATLILIIICSVSGDFETPKINSGWIAILASHAFYAYAMITFYIAISSIGARETTFYNNIEPIMAVGAGYLFLNQNLSILQYLGISIVLVALLYNGKKVS